MPTAYRGVQIPAGPDDANVPLSFQQFVDAILPVGVVRMIYDTVAPAGWLLMDGGAIPLGPTYDAIRAKVGGGSMPDMRGRFAVMPNGTTVSTIGSIGGAATVHLETAHLPAHAHIVSHGHSASGSTTSDGAHVHALDTWSPFGGSAQPCDACGDGWAVHTNGMGGGGHGHTLSITVDINYFWSENTGSDVWHENMPPYRGINFMMKY